MLPSSRLPPAVVEEMRRRHAEEEEERRKQTQKLVEKEPPKVKRSELFMRDMVAWYKNMTKKEKDKVTPLKLKRQAIKVAFNHSFVYETLPRDWVYQLMRKTGLKLTEAKSKKKGSSEKAESSRACQAPSSEAEKVILVTECGEDGKPVQKKRKLLDLTEELPPPDWLAAYAKGTVLPRMITMYSTGDTDILFYDYNPKLKDSAGNPVKLNPTPRFNEKVYEEMIKLTPEELNKGDCMYL